MQMQSELASSKQLEAMTLVTPHDLAIISIKGAHSAAQARHLGESETRVSRRVNFHSNHGRRSTPVGDAKDHGKAIQRYG